MIEPAKIPQRKRIAFLTATFPALSETFVLREYEYLTKSGDLDVKAFAIRRPSEKTINPEYRNLMESVLYLRPDHLLGILLANLKALIFKPVKYAKALCLFTGALSSQPICTWSRQFFHLTSGVYLADYLRKRNFCSIHAHFESAGNIALFARMMGFPEFTVTLHASNDLYYGMKPFLDGKLREARVVVTDSEYNMSQINLLTHYKYADKLVMIYNSVDVKAFEKSSEKGSTDGTIKLLSIGNFTGVKGYPTVLAALKELKERGIRFLYHIIGDGNEGEKNMVTNLISQYELTGSIELLGWRFFAEVMKELEWCDVVVMNSEIGEAGKRDGFPTVIMEAMLAKRLVVSTYISDIPNIIEHAETGYLVPEKNAQALADILCHIIHHFEETVEIVKNAHTFARINFDSQTNHSKLEMLLKGGDIS